MSSVHVIRSTARGGTRSVYHTDEDCPHFPSKASTWDRELAEAWGLRECDYCG
jgi:hypothetical protein